MTRARFRARRSKVCGQVAEWLKAADCKSALARVRWFESSPVHQLPERWVPHPTANALILVKKPYGFRLRHTATYRLQPRYTMVEVWG